MDDTKKKPPFFSPKVQQRALVTIACFVFAAVGLMIAKTSHAEVVEAPPAKVLGAVEGPIVTQSVQTSRSEILPQPSLVKHTNVTAVKDGIEDNYFDNEAIVDFLLALRKQYTCVLISGADSGVRLKALNWSAHRTGCVVVNFTEVIEEDVPQEATLAAEIGS